MQHLLAQGVLGVRGMIHAKPLMFRMDHQVIDIHCQVIGNESGFSQR